MQFNAIHSVVKHSPILTLVSMIMSFILVFVLQVFYYATEVFSGYITGIAYALAVGIALMFQLARVAFGISGAYDFSNGHTGKGILGMLFSITLTAIESFEVVHFAESFANGSSRVYSSALLAFQVIVWLGFALEIRLATSVSKKPKSNSESDIILEKSQIGKKRSSGVKVNGVA